MHIKDEILTFLHANNFSFSQVATMHDYGL